MQGALNVSKNVSEGCVDLGKDSIDLENDNIKSITINEFQLLIYLNKNKIYTPIKSATYYDMARVVGLSINQIRKSMTKFLRFNYVAEGLKQTNSKRFYITQLGIQLIEKVNKETLI